VRFIVRGLVQGVGFRWFVLREAQRLAGWVTNREDGAVEVVALGPAAGLSELERALGRGPRGARVMSVEKSDVPHEVAGEKTFEIR
jgi:acylphosphatase